MTANSKNIIEFTLFYNRYKRKIYNYILKMTLDKNLSEDIIQNVFLKLFENLNLIRNKNSVQFWLFRTARNEIFTHFRKKKVVRENISLMKENSSNHSEYNLSELYELKEIKTMVIKLLNELPEEQKEVYLLREYGGLSYSEIAEITEIEEKTVKSRLYKVRQKLIKNLSKVI